MFRVWCEWRLKDILFCYDIRFSQLVLERNVKQRGRKLDVKHDICTEADKGQFRHVFKIHDSA